MSDATPHDGGHGEHAEHTNHTSTYITIFLILGLLTVVEIFVPQVWSSEWNKHTKMILLTLLAIGKATLVAFYFMHLKWEKPWLKWIALMPAYMAVFVILLMLETVYRQSIVVGG